MIELDDVKAAANRIRPLIRRTPQIRTDQLRQPVTSADLVLKLECHQVSGSFKARGAANRLMSLSPEKRIRGLVAASGGNHGLAVARCGHVAGTLATLFLPDSVSPEKVEKARLWGADCHVGGADFDECSAAARAFAEHSGGTYIHPFSDPDVVAGQGTVALEMLEDRPDTETVIVAIGGGGFITGAGTVIKTLDPSIRVIGVEPVGSPTLHASLAAGKVVTLPEIQSAIPTMSCRRTDERIFDRIREVVDEVVLITDNDMVRAAQWLWFELGIAADPAGAAAVAALMSGAYQARDGERVTVAICGAGLP